jgi:hypothetical protein
MKLDIDLSLKGKLEIYSFFSSYADITITIIDDEENKILLTLEKDQFKELKNKLNEQLEEFI